MTDVGPKDKEVEHTVQKSVQTNSSARRHRYGKYGFCYTTFQPKLILAVENNKLIALFLYHILDYYETTTFDDTTMTTVSVIEETTIDSTTESEPDEPTTKIPGMTYYKYTRYSWRKNGDRKKKKNIDTSLREADIRGGFGQLLYTLSARGYAYTIVHYMITAKGTPKRMLRLRLAVQEELFSTQICSNK